VSSDLPVGHAEGRMARTPQESFTFVGLVPGENPAVGTLSVAVEVLDRLREIEADEHRKAANRARPLASQARHEGVATGISIALSAIEGSAISIPAEFRSIRNRRNSNGH